MMAREDTLPEALAVSGAEGTSPVGVVVVEAAGGRQVIGLQPGETVLGSAPAHGAIGCRGVAPAHLAFEAAEGQVRVRSLAPLRRNGWPVRRARLRSGDRLRFGEATARFVGSQDAILLEEHETRPVAWAASGLACGYLAALFASLLVPAEAVRAAPEKAAAPAAGVEAAAPPPPVAGVEAAREEGAASIVVAPLYIGEAAPPDAAPIALASAATPPGGTRSASAGGERYAALGDGMAGEGGEHPAPRGIAGRGGGRSRAPSGAGGERPASSRGVPVNGSLSLRAPREILERLWAAWEAGALQDVHAIASGARDPEAARIGALARRFERSARRARRTPGLAAVPALEEALAIAEEIGRRSLAADEVRGRLAALHVEGAKAAIAAKDWAGALHHCEQALAIRPGDRTAGSLRADLAGRAAAFYQEAYALQHLDPGEALQRAELARLLATPGGALASRAASLATRLRAAQGTGL